MKQMVAYKYDSRNQTWTEIKCMNKKGKTIERFKGLMYPSYSISCNALFDAHYQQFDVNNYSIDESDASDDSDDDTDDDSDVESG